MRKRAFLIISGILVLIGAFGSTLFVSTDNLSQFGATLSNEKLEQMKQSPNFDGKRFHNSNPIKMTPGFGTFWDMMYRMLLGPELRKPKMKIPVVPLAKSSFDKLPPEGLRVTWMGHSTVLIEIDGKRILTDPMWSKRCSPFKIVGPARFFKPPIALEDLPHLDG